MGVAPTALATLDDAPAAGADAGETTWPGDTAGAPAAEPAGLPLAELAGTAGALCCCDCDCDGCCCWPFTADAPIAGLLTAAAAGAAVLGWA